MWTWVWYTHSKILRGELYEALDALQYLRGNVLFPLLAISKGRRASGSRRAEQIVGDLATAFAATAPRLDQDELFEALLQVVDLYRRLGDPLMAEREVEPQSKARAVVLEALDAGLGFAYP